MKTYEEKYKKALEWMREVYPTLQGAAKEDAEYYFPELCESEDEKIRQLLLRFVKYDMSDNYSDDFTPADCVAWLEKQGKNNMGISEATKKKLEDNLNKALEQETPETLNKFLEKQGEKKSIESTKTKLNESMIKPDPNPYWTLAPEYKLMNEQNPAWSEEDEELLNTIINHFKVNVECTDDDDIIKWLKSLKDRVQPQSHWKPSDEHYELEEFAKIVRGNLTGISKDVQKLFESKYLQLTGKKMYGGFKD